MRWLLRSLLGVAVLLMLALALVVGVNAWLGRGAFYPERVRERLGQYLAGDVRVARAGLDLLARRLHAHNISVHATSLAPPAFSVAELRVDLPLPSARGMLPERVEIWRPMLRLTERSDGTLSPLDLLKPPPAAESVPVVWIKEGTLLFSGDGPFARRLDDILAADLPRRLDDLEFVTWPVPADDLFGFRGQVRLPRIGVMRVQGAVGRDGSLELRATTGHLRLDRDALLGCLRPQLAQAVEDVAHDGSLVLTVDLSVPGARGGRPGVKVLLEAHDITLELPFVRVPVQIESGSIVWDGREASVREVAIAGQGERLELNGRLRPRPTGVTIAEVLGDYFFELRGQGLSFADGLAACVDHLPTRQSIDEFAPRGSYDVAAEVLGHPGESPQVRWSVRPRRASASYVGRVHDQGRSGFPYPIHELEGEVAGVPGRIELRSLRGRLAGGGDARVDGAVILRGPGNSVLDLTVRADGVPITELPLHGLEHVAPGSRAVVDNFGELGRTLGGTADVEVRVWSVEPHLVHHQVDIWLQDGRCEPRWFPYPVELHGGSLRVRDGQVEVHGVGASHAATHFTVDGRVWSAPAVSGVVPPSPGLALHIVADGLALEDEALRRALRALVGQGDAPREAVAALDTWLPARGALAAALDIDAVPGGPIYYTAQVDAADVALLLEPFPVPIDAGAARVTIDNRTADLVPRFAVIDATGRLGGQLVSGLARVEAGALVELHARGDAVPITGELLAAGRKLCEEQVVAQAWIDRLQPVGHAAFDVAITPGADGPKPRIDLRLRQSTLRAAELPGGELAQADVDLLIEPHRGALAARNLRGRLAGARGEIASRQIQVDFGDPAHVSGDLRLRDLAVDAGLAASVGEPTLAALVAEQGLLGTVDVDLDRLVLAAPSVMGGSAGAASLRIVDYAGRVQLKQMSLRAPLGLDRVDASVEVEGHAVAGGDELRHRGVVDAATLRVLRPSRAMEGAAVVGIDVAGLTARYRLDADALVVTDVEAVVAGGRLPAAGNRIELGRGGAGGFTGEFQVEGAHLKSVVGWLSDATVGIEGGLDLRFDFAGEGGLSTLRGRGVATVEDGRLWELPVLADLYRNTLGAALGQTRSPVFRDGEIRFIVSQGRVELERFSLDAPVGPTMVGLKLEGDGSVDFQGNVRMRIDPTVIDTRIPLLTPFIDALKRRLVSYEIGGTLANPRIAYANPVGGLFGLLPTGEDAIRRPRLPPRSATDWSKRF